jgi:putative N6-adenine-specific DNA methylase
MDIRGSDVDGRMIELAIANAKAAGVNRHIRFDRADVKAAAPRGEYGTIVCNPPYGKTLLDEEKAAAITKAMGKAFGALPTWGAYVISAVRDFEKLYGRKAARRRKVYNGPILCNYYQYPGPRKPRPISPA